MIEDVGGCRIERVAGSLESGSLTIRYLSTLMYNRDRGESCWKARGTSSATG